ncbi:uncharacterized protein LOC109802694 [Cajanus cajan]|uniref:uncharacterized protein LOC109802694 n=1 Tax=Cajanus cajan TaxID=3821 RepID=UPI00098DBCCB|nr:uncharacterized protein LOC109802694 [Cajanus cajan]
MVGNGDFLPCTTYCPQAQITLASLKFPIDLYPLDLSGTDIVLGVQWLTQISPFIMDYNGPFMRFMWEGNMVELKGEHSSSPIPITAHQLRRLHHTNRVEALFQLILEPSSPTLPLPPQTQQPQTNSTIPSIAPPPFQSLLIKYCTLFTTPTSLPPSRSTDHSIPLLPNTPPISVRPYHYPHFQKQEIKTQVAKMLESGFITPNISPFSSPVLLVKKKDGTWRFCVDYRALNPATVKDKFPIPTVDELLDELGHASWFSKLDLFSGFHQILMVPSDSKKTAFRTHNSHFEFKVMPFGLWRLVLASFDRRSALVFCSRGTCCIVNSSKDEICCDAMWKYRWRSTSLAWRELGYEVSQALSFQGTATFILDAKLGQFYRPGYHPSGELQLSQDLLD